MYLIAGLGNIGNNYKNSRHNVGFLSLDYIIEKNNLNYFKKKSKYYYSLNSFNDNDAVFIKPTTFMNLSGFAILSAMKFFKIDIKKILIIYDDMDLPFGKIRIREKGTSGTHNGLKSIQAILGRTDYKRIRIGIDRPEHPGEAISHVLGNFTSEELIFLNQKIFDLVEDATKLVINNKIKDAMNKYNGINI